MSRVLIIEDEVEIADLEKDYLELSGFEVEIENDGTVGLKRALAEDFDQTSARTVFIFVLFQKIRTLYTAQNITITSVSLYLFLFILIPISERLVAKMR